MLFTTEDRILIKHYRLDKNMAVGQYAWISEKKPWSASRLDKFIKEIDVTGGTDRTNGSGKPKLLNQKIGHQTALPWTQTCGLQHFGKFVTKTV